MSDFKQSMQARQEEKTPVRKPTYEELLAERDRLFAERDRLVRKLALLERERRQMRFSL